MLESTSGDAGSGASNNIHAETRDSVEVTAIEDLSRGLSNLRTMDRVYWNDHLEQISSLVNTTERNSDVDRALFEIYQKVGGSEENVYAWLYLTGVLAKVLPHPCDPPSDIRSGPGFHAFDRAVSMMLGPRGLMHGWSGETPNTHFVSECLAHGGESFLRRLWNFNVDTDGESSYHSDSPTYSDSPDHADSDWHELLCPDAQYPQTRSALSDGDTLKIPSSGMRVEACLNMVGIDDPEVRQNVKRFSIYLARSNRARRVRRSLRRQRRLPRMISPSPSYDPEQAYLLEFKREEILKSERIQSQINLMNFCDDSNGQLKFGKKMTVDKPTSFSIRLPPIRLQDGILHKEVALMRVHALRDFLKFDIIHSWLQFYGNERGLDASEELNCWVTPIRFIRQNGPK